MQTYFSTVEAVAATGSVKVSTDGVTIVNNNTELEGVIVNDGPICSGINNFCLFMPSTVTPDIRLNSMIS